MIRRILVPLDLSEHTEAATSRSCEIASSLEASITGVTIIDTKGISDAVALPFHGELFDYPHPTVEMMQDAAFKLKAARERFDNTCSCRDVVSHVRRLSGSPAKGILDLARFHDLLILGLETHFHFETEDKPGDTLNEVLDLTPIPVLLVPPPSLEPYHHAVIAYDGSPSSTRALHAFAAFWPVYKPEVRIVYSGNDKDLGGHLLEEAKKYLEVHHVEHIETELETESLKHAFEERHLDWADLIVAGVRSKRIFKHLFVGSFTRHLIDRGDHALLLSL